MKFGMGLTTELTQKYAKVKVDMTYVHPHIYINKYPQFSIALPMIVSRSFHSLANNTECVDYSTFSGFVVQHHAETYCNQHCY